MAQRETCWAAVVLFVVLCVGLPAQSDTSEACYSRQAGYSQCWNGCCGPDGDRSCCSPTFLVLGLALGASVLLIVVILIVVCFVCKECRPKDCCGQAEGQGRRRRRGRRGGGGGGGGGGRGRRSSRSRRVLVQPVQPPDYATATQLRAPSVQPGYYQGHVPMTPPPPYMETLSRPPTALPLDAAPPTTSHAPNHHSLPISGQAGRVTSPMGIAVAARQWAESSRAEGGYGSCAGEPSQSSPLAAVEELGHSPARSQLAGITHDRQADARTRSNRRQNVRNVFVVQPSGPVTIHASGTPVILSPGPQTRSGEGRGRESRDGQDGQDLSQSDSSIQGARSPPPSLTQDTRIPLSNVASEASTSNLAAGASQRRDRGSQGRLNNPGTSSGQSVSEAAVDGDPLQMV